MPHREHDPTLERPLEAEAMVEPLVATDVGAMQRPTLAPLWLLKGATALTGLFTFVLALQLIKEGAQVYGNAIVGLLSVSNPLNALGFGWLLSYCFLSGSPVAAIAIAFFASGTLNSLQTFTMITGSRLGASLIVLVAGFFYYVRGYQRAASVAIGVLALLTTTAIYLPALVLGYWLLSSGILGALDVGAHLPMFSLLDRIYDPILAAMARLGVPAWVVLILGVGALIGAFKLLDRALPEVSADQSAFRRIGQLIYRPAAMFALGAAVTIVTLSVSVSVGILVPLSARGLVRRENVLPYIMGVNITTFVDTLVAALIVGGVAAFTIVLIEMLSVAVLSLLVLLVCYRPFERVILGLQDRIISGRRSLVGFLGIMFVVPIILLLVR